MLVCCKTTIMSFYQKETNNNPPKNKKIHSSESFFSVWTIIWESQQTFDKIESLLIICIFFTTPEWVFGRRWLSCRHLWLSLSTWDKVTANKICHWIQSELFVSFSCFIQLGMFRSCVSEVPKLQVGNMPSPPLYLHGPAHFIPADSLLSESPRHERGTLILPS